MALLPSPRSLTGWSGELPAPSATAGTGMLVSEAFWLLLGPCLIHIQCTFVQQSAIQSSDRFVSVFCVGHLHKGEPAWLAGVAVHHDLDLGYRPECCEKLAKCPF